MATERLPRHGYLVMQSKDDGAPRALPQESAVGLSLDKSEVAYMYFQDRTRVHRGNLKFSYTAALLHSCHSNVF